MTQPAVALQIKTLEAELALKLFERRSSGVFLTDAGKLLLKYAEDLHRFAEEAQSELACIGGGTAGELVLGASTTIAQYVLPAALAEFSRNYPEVQLQVLSENTEHIAEGFASGRFSLGLIEGPALRTNLKVERWFDDELLIIVPQSHDWAGQVEVDPESLRHAPGDA